MAKVMLAPTVVYCMPIWLLSRANFNRFDKLLRGFIWAAVEGSKKVHSASWALFTAPKAVRLGLLNMRAHCMA